MKQIFSLITLFMLIGGAYAINPAPTVKTPLKASAINIPVGPNGEQISLEELAYIKPREFSRISGKSMSIFDKAGFLIAQKKLRNEINRDGTLSGKKYEKLAASMDGETGFHLGGFALGFLLGLIGVLIAYLINDDKKSNRRKWAWLGLGAVLVLTLIIVLAGA